MAQALSFQSLAMEAQVQFWASPYGIFCGQNGTGTGFPPSTSVFPCQNHSTGGVYGGPNGSGTDLVWIFADSELKFQILFVTHL
jgi:hypothetical protein